MNLSNFLVNTKKKKSIFFLRIYVSIIIPSEQRIDNNHPYTYLCTDQEAPKKQGSRLIGGHRGNILADLIRGCPYFLKKIGKKRIVLIVPYILVLVISQFEC